MRVNGKNIDSVKAMEGIEREEQVKAQTAPEDKYIAPKASTSEDSSVTEDFFGGFDIPDSAEEDNVHGGDTSSWLSEMGEEQAQAESQSGMFIPPDFADIQAELGEKANQTTVIEAIISKYEDSLAKLAAYEEELRGSLNPLAAAYLQQVRRGIQIHQVEIQEATAFLLELKSLDRREMASWKDLNEDGKIGDYRVVEDIYGRELIINQAGHLVSMSNFEAEGGASGIDYRPELFSGDLKFKYKDDDGSFHLSMEDLVEKFNNGETGHLGINIPPTIWVKLDSDGLVDAPSGYDGKARCKARGLDSDGKQMQATENYMQIPVTNVEIESVRADGEEAHVTKTVIRLEGLTPDGRKVTLMELVIDPEMGADGRMISSAGMPMKVDVCGDIETWKGDPAVIDIDAENFKPTTYCKYSENQMNEWGLNDMFNAEKQGYLTGNISGTRYSFADSTDTDYMLEEDFSYNVDHYGPTTLPINSDDPIYTDRDGMMTTGIVFDIKSAGRITGTSGNDVFVVHDRSEYVDYPDNYFPDSVGAQYTTCVKGGLGENMIVGRSNGTGEKEIGYGTVAAKDVTMADIRDTSSDDQIMIGSPSKHGENYQRKVKLTGDGTAYIIAEDEIDDEYMKHAAYENEKWHTEGDVVNITGMTLFDGGVTDPDTDGMSCDVAAFDAWWDGMDNYERKIDPAEIIENYEQIWETEDEEATQELESEMNGFFSNIGDIDSILG